MRLSHMLKEVLKTERLVIKPPEIDDKIELTQLINDYEVVQWLSNMPFPYQLEDAEVFIEPVSYTHLTLPTICSV